MTSTVPVVTSVTPTIPATIKLYRCEDEKNSRSLWRDFAGNWHPQFHLLTDGQCRNMPMPDSDVYRQEGKRWFASTPSRETLRKWFSKQDLDELTAHGFTISEFEVTEWKPLNEFEYIFTRESIVSRRYLKVEDIYPPC